MEDLMKSTSISQSQAPVIDIAPIITNWNYIFVFQTLFQIELSPKLLWPCLIRNLTQVNFREKKEMEPPNDLPFLRYELCSK